MTTNLSILSEIDIMAYRSDSGVLNPNAVHARQNCASDFHSLAGQLTDHMLNDGKQIALATLTQCIQAREADSARYGAMDQAHQIPYYTLINLRNALSQVPDTMRAGVHYQDKPMKFHVQLDTPNPQTATVTWQGITYGDRPMGGRRKLTRKRRVTRRRKTYRH
jgi:hypothetical protein